MQKLEERRHFEPLVKQDSDNKIYLSGAIYLQSGNHAYYLYVRHRISIAIFAQLFHAMEDDELCL